MTRVLADPKVVLDGFRFPEGSRWHGGQLWWSDMHTGQVFTLRPEASDATEVLKLTDDQSSGLGWLPDGSMLVSGMLKRKVWRLSPGGDLSLHADLSALTAYPINDMLVDSSGRAYLGGFGYDLYGGGERHEASVYLIEPTGHVTVAVQDMSFPNGTVVLPGGRTMVIAESFARRLTAFDITEQGRLTSRRTWAELPPDGGPDGICVDVQGGIWVASPGGSQFFRVEEGGSVTDRVDVPGRMAVDCVLGGADGTTLYLLTSDSTAPTDTVGTRAGRIEAVNVPVPGAVS